METDAGEHHDEAMELRNHCDVICNDNLRLNNVAGLNNDPVVEGCIDESDDDGISLETIDEQPRDFGINEIASDDGAMVSGIEFDEDDPEETSRDETVFEDDGRDNYAEEHASNDIGIEISDKV